MKDLAQICKTDFGATLDQFTEALLTSPNARGYILGSVSELLLKDYLVGKGYRIKRIKEKWVGPKKHFGDYYISRNESDWYVLESKGLKSNAERWAGIRSEASSPVALRRHFDRLRAGQLKKWWDRQSRDRQELIITSGTFNKARVLATHFVSGTGTAGRTIATPRKDEFDAVSVDLFLRTGTHEFIFASPSGLEPSETDPNHLQQNYLIDILLPGQTAVSLPTEWTRDFDNVFDRFQKPVNPKEMQVDERSPGEREGDSDDYQ